MSDTVVHGVGEKEAVKVSLTVLQPLGVCDALCEGLLEADTLVVPDTE